MKIRVEMTSLEANAVLRGLAAGNQEVAPRDRAPITWVAQRILALLATQPEKEQTKWHRSTPWI
jgi:hypothetical protein